MIAMRKYSSDWFRDSRVLTVFFLLALSNVNSSTSFATTLLVPENYTFEAALVAAVDGDSVSVAPNTIDGNVVDITQSITLLSREIGANRLIGVSADSLEQVRVEGFLVGATGYIGETYEGGVRIQASNVAFTDCEFSYLWTVSGPPIAFGADCKILFERCTFHDNYWQPITKGAAVEGNCIVMYNHAETDEGDLTIRDCVFRDQSSPVVSWVPVTIETTRFLDCGQFLITSYDSLEMYGCLVADFQQYMLSEWLVPECLGVSECIQAFGNVTIQGNTFVDTTVPPGPIIGPCAGTVYPPEQIPATIKIDDTGSGLIENNLFVGLPAAAVDAPAMVDVNCNDTWGVNGPAWRGGIGDVTGTNGNINEAPLFCARWAGDYTLSSHSPAAAENSPCGRMGAYDTACEITPVLVQAFTGRRVAGGVELRWDLSEAQEVFLRRLDSSSSAEVYRGQGAGGIYLDPTAPAGELHYGLGIIRDGEEMFPLETVTVAAGETPTHTALLGAFPNPFNPRTEIRFVLDRAQAPVISIYDTEGRLVHRFAAKQYSAGPGSVTWNGQDDSEYPVASGVYFVQMLAEGKQLVQRVALIR